MLARSSRRDAKKKTNRGFKASSSWYNSDATKFTSRSSLLMKWANPERERDNFCVIDGIIIFILSIFRVTHSICRGVEFALVMMIPCIPIVFRGDLLIIKARQSAKKNYVIFVAGEKLNSSIKLWLSLFLSQFGPNSIKREGVSLKIQRAYFRSTTSNTRRLCYTRCHAIVVNLFRWKPWRKQYMINNLWYMINNLYVYIKNYIDSIEK